MRKKLVAVAVAMLMSFVAGSASAMMGGGKGMMDGKGRDGDGKGMMMKGEGLAGHFMKMVDMLELTGDQKKAVEAIHFAHRKELIRKEADIDVAEVELQEIMGKEPVKMEEAEKKIRAIAAFHADLDIMHLKAREAVKAKLTPEQLEKLKKHMAEAMKEKMEDKGGMKMGGMDMGGGKMAGKSKNCAMMGDDSGGAKAADADAAGKDVKKDAAPEAKSEEKKADHSAHH